MPEPLQSDENSPSTPSRFSRLIGALRKRWNKPADSQLTFNFESQDKPPVEPMLPTERFVVADTSPVNTTAPAEPAPAAQTPAAPVVPAVDPLADRPTVGVTQWIGTWRERWMLASSAARARREAQEAIDAQAQAEAAAAEAKANAVAAQPAEPAQQPSQWRSAFSIFRRKEKSPESAEPSVVTAPLEPAPTAEVLSDIPSEMPAEKPARFAPLRAWAARFFTRRAASESPSQSPADAVPVEPAPAAEPAPVEPAPTVEAPPARTAMESTRATLAGFFSRRARAQTEPAPEPVPARPLTPAELADRRINRVARVAMIALTLAFTGLVVRVVQLQAVPPTPIARLMGTQKSVVKIQETRGKIEDSSGRILAATTAVKQLFVDPKLIEDPATFSERVGAALGMNPAEIEKKISSRLDKRYVVIHRELNDDQIEKLKTFKLPGLGTDTRLVRRYPEGQLAGHLIGYVGFDGKGLEGTEKTLNTLLTGKPGQIGYLRDARRRPLWIEDSLYQLPQDGQSVHLSIDAVVQSIVEKELADACQQYDAESGSVVMLNPYTGEILAMANYPAVEPATFGISPAERRRNRAVTDTFEPGSTFKPFIWSFATELGYAKPSEPIDCTTSGHWTSANGRRLRDSHPVGLVDWETVLVKSSNIGMAIVGQRMGAEAIHKAVASFGFGERTQSGLPGEVRGKVRPFNRWTHYSVTSIPMGQEVSVTGLQMARAFSVFANGGWLPKPTYLALDPMDAAVAAADSRPVLKQSTVLEMRQVLRRVVTEGTGKKADSPLYDIFGKTGTAQIAGGKGGYIPDAYIGSFVCAAPVQNPQVVVECIIRKPDRRKGYYGGTVAAPAARRIIEQTLNYMGVQPNAPKDDDSDKPVIAANASLRIQLDD